MFDELFFLSGLAPVMLFVGLGLLAFPYLALRTQDARADKPDPQLGLKSALHFFFSLGLLIALTGGTVALTDAIEGLIEPNVPAAQGPPVFVPQPGMPGGGPWQPAPPPPKPKKNWANDTQRTAAALALTGAMVALLGWAAVRIGTNDREYPAVNRAYVGARLGLAGLAAVAALCGVNVYLFREDVTNHRPLEVLIAVLLVWSPTALVHLVLLRAKSGTPYYVPKPERRPRPAVARRAERRDDSDAGLDDERPGRDRPDRGEKES
jgi:hypothetical protein